LINEVVARLKSHATALTDVLIAEDLDAISKGVAPKHGTTFVLPYREKGEPNELGTGGFRQFVAVQLLIVFILRKHDDAKGGKKAADYDALKSSIEDAMAGWATDPRNELFEMVAGQATPLGNGVTAYVQTWQTSRYLEKD
jgi:hypothetical protein